QAIRPLGRDERAGEQEAHRALARRRGRRHGLEQREREGERPWEPERLEAVGEVEGGGEQDVGRGQRLRGRRQAGGDALLVGREGLA
ncbi:hypothetical protein EDM76_14010, partial [bacterium]